MKEHTAGLCREHTSVIVYENGALKCYTGGEELTEEDIVLTILWLVNFEEVGTRSLKDIISSLEEPDV